jgi:hypothetical protein
MRGFGMLADFGYITDHFALAKLGRFLAQWSLLSRTFKSFPSAADSLRFISCAAL